MRMTQISRALRAAVSVGRSGRPGPIMFSRAARAYGLYQYDNIIICIQYYGKDIYFVLPLSPLQLHVTCKNPIYPCSMSYYFEGAYFIWDSGLHGMHFCKYVAIGCYPKLKQTC